ncbi:MAG: dihydrolipoyl dehydrogenase, partial [Sedimentisphaerales bacterium]
GYAAAIRCAQRGASVAVIEKGLVGGTCLNCGCIPSKTLLASAHTLLMIKHAAMMGVDVPSASPNWPKIQARKDAVVGAFRKGLTGLVKSHKVTIIEGRAVVTAPGQVRIESDAGRTEIQAGAIILATGSQPVEIPAFPFDGQTVISSKEALGLQEIPQSMVIVGGGVIGCEMACVYAAMGTKVTIVEALARLIPMEDDWVGRMIEREFKKLGIASLTSQKVTSVETATSPATVMLESGQSIDAEKVLVSVGRRAAIDKETVEALNLQMNGPAIAVNERLQTNIPGVYALGDAVATTYLAHGAFVEAEVVAANATGGDEKITDYSLVPRAVYTFPEIASVGMTEEACRAKGLDVSVGKAFFKANGRSNAHNETAGEIRVIRNTATDKIVGVTMVGATVTELIGAARALIGTTEKIAEISFPHPTFSEVLKEAAEDAFGFGLHNPPRP